MTIPIRVFETVTDITTLDYLNNIAMKATGKVELLTIGSTQYAVYTLN